MLAELTGSVLPWALGACLLAFLLTGAVRRVAIRRDWLDVPNRRSSHLTATPRGGGVALVLVILPAVAANLHHGGTPAWPVIGTLLAAAMALAVIGLLDDFRPLSITGRFAVQVLAVAATLWATGGLPTIDIGGVRLEWGLSGQLLLGLGCVWFVNLFNFMDGIDGIAAAEAAFIGLAAATLMGQQVGGTGLVATWAVLGAASAGFLAWNWAPARIFMGDVGSGFLGFMIAMLLVLSVQQGGLSLWTGIVLVAPFLVDTTVTLVRRMARGERWYLAHRTHAYQWLARRWGSHARVTALSIAVNMLAIAPLAWVCQRLPAAAPLIAAAVLLLLAIAAWRAGAGRPEDTGGAAPGAGGDAPRQEP